MNLNFIIELRFKINDIFHRFDFNHRFYRKVCYFGRYSLRFISPDCSGILFFFYKKRKDTAESRKQLQKKTTNLNDLQFVAFCLIFVKEGQSRYYLKNRLCQLSAAGTSQCVSNSSIVLTKLLKTMVCPFTAFSFAIFLKSSNDL